MMTGTARKKSTTSHDAQRTGLWSESLATPKNMPNTTAPSTDRTAITMVSFHAARIALKYCGVTNGSHRAYSNWPASANRFTT